MEHISAWVLTIVETSGMFAPLLFIAFHLLRPILLMPVAFICVSGGILFGMVSGTIYSIVGITLSSLMFYRMVVFMPKTYRRLVKMKAKLIGQSRQMSKGQIVILRLMPFIHFHLLSICILEMSKNYRDYFKLSFFSNIPLAFVYTSFGQWISTFSPVIVMGVVIAFIPMLYLLRQKEMVIKWEVFFQKEEKNVPVLTPNQHQRVYKKSPV